MKWIRCRIKSTISALGSLVDSELISIEPDCGNLVSGRQGLDSISMLHPNPPVLAYMES